jgi:hypothetical protein
MWNQWFRLKKEAVCFRNVVYVFSILVAMEAFLVNAADISHAELLSKICMLQLLYLHLTLVRIQTSAGALSFVRT